MMVVVSRVSMGCVVMMVVMSWLRGRQRRLREPGVGMKMKQIERPGRRFCLFVMMMVVVVGVQVMVMMVAWMCRF